MDPEISGLPSNIFYHKLDNVNEDYSHLNAPSWELYIKSHPIKGKGFFNALLKAFYYVSYYDIRDTFFYNERWNYLYFWMGLKLLNDLGDSIFSDVMSVLKVVRSVINENKQYNDDMFTIDIVKFNDLKKIYDYLQDFASIKARIGHRDAPCTAAYKEYVTTAHNFYIKEKTNCNGNNKDNYCKVVNRFIHEYGNDITELTCTGLTSPEYYEAQNLEDTGTETFSLGYGTQAERANHMPLPARDVSPSSGSTNALSVAFPLLGTLSTLFVFLKFTPFGSQLYNGFLKKKLIQNNQEKEGTYEILENSYGYPNGNIEDTEHHIAYSSM
ncbi:PIR protein [Plasmodium ovale]|uniref:PIR protein n=1 Tax=Plasmodium ovale TaxID=36330 RepID=A0A1D3JEB9_PLAOA|nr:PIR protein [Plasmodium ovale]